MGPPNLKWRQRYYACGPAELEMLQEKFKEFLFLFLFFLRKYFKVLWAHKQA
jgi:hypothetical protein